LRGGSRARGLFTCKLSVLSGRLNFKVLKINALRFLFAGSVTCSPVIHSAGCELAAFVLRALGAGKVGETRCGLLKKSVVNNLGRSLNCMPRLLLESRIAGLVGKLRGALVRSGAAFLMKWDGSWEKLRVARPL
jgi:hypothetical protein